MTHDAATQILNELKPAPGRRYELLQTKCKPNCHGCRGCLSPDTAWYIKSIKT
jgi:hypothetical protein